MITHAIGPIAKRPVEVQAADALRRSIVSGALPPGTRVTEMRLASELELSRATVRTALHELTKEGLIVQTPYTGWTVVPLTTTSAWELYTLRSALEGLAARLATESLTTAGRDELNAAFARLAASCASADREAIADADFGLHMTVVTLARHSRLALQYRIVEHQVRMYITCSDALIADPDVIREQHRPIIDSILSGDPGRAGQVSEDHNLVEGKILVACLERSGLGDAARLADTSGNSAG